MKIFASLIAILALICPLTMGVAASSAQAPDPRPVYTLYTAGIKGTYYRFAEDITRACPNLNIQIVSTDGSLDNVNHLIEPQAMRAGHRFGFVQNDAMVAVLGSEPRAKSLVKTVMPMYPEDITVLVNRASNINSMRDLEGKRVAVGVIGSGVWFTASSMRAQLGVNWIPVERSPEESILGVLVGDLDAMISVGGHPFKLYSELGAYVRDRVKLVPMTDTELNKLYASSKLPADTYLWQDQDVELRTTRSLLIASADVPQSAVNALTSCISTSLNELRRWGHPRWNDVHLPLIKK
jgi:TRAP transporter TAXI family solute receptor